MESEGGIFLTERKKPSARPDHNEGRAPVQQANMGLEHGSESLVAMDNPDDSQLGAEIRKGEGMRR